MTAPSWLLLAWCGLAASCAAAIAGSLMPRAERDRPRSAIVRSAAAGLIALPLIYGLIFEALQKADFRTGLALGAAHGVLAVLLAARRTGPHAPPRVQLRIAARAAVLSLVYGVTIGFLYVTP
jgi:hypothetical protein